VAKRTVCWILGFCLAWLIVGLVVQARAAHGQRLDVQTLDTVVVTAGRIEERARDVSRFVTVIPQEEIQKNQYQNMAGLLRNYGLQIDHHAANEAQGQVKIRGVFTSTLTNPGDQGGVLILVDGRRIGTNNINMIPMVNVERIEILRGPASAQYGSSAIGGVVNVITKRGTEKLEASVQAGAGSWDSYRGQGSMAWGQGPFDFSGGVSYLTRGNYYVGGNKKYPNTRVDDKIAYSFNTGFSFLEEHRIGATLLGVDALGLGSPNIFDGVDRKSFLDISSHSADFVYEGGYRAFGLAWKGRYFFGRENYTTDYKGEPDMVEWFPSWLGPRQSYTRMINDYQGAQGQLSFQKSILTLTGGVDWMYSDTSRRNRGFNMPATKESLKNDNLGVFALATIALFDDRLFVNAGVRHDTYQVKAGGNKKNLEKTVPSFGLAFHATDWLTLKGNYGESYRVPDALAVLGYQGGMYGSNTHPNPDLKPEQATNWDLGFEINHNSLQIGLSYFETEHKKRIVRSFEGGAWLFQNAGGKIWYKGFEGNMSYDIGEAFDWPVMLRPYVNFTALTERKASKGAIWGAPELGNRVPNVSDLEAAYGVNFAYPDIGFAADLRFTYMGHQYNMSDISYEFERNGGKTIADLFLSQRIHSSDKGTLSAFGEIRNIGDVRYAMTLGYPMPGRSFFAGLRYDF